MTMNTIDRLTFLRYAAALFSGFLLWTAYPPAAQAESAWFALIPVLYIIRHSTPRQAFAATGIGSMLFWVMTLSWFPAIIKNGGPWILVILGQVALAAWCSLYFALFAFASARVWSWAGATPSWRRVVAVTLADPLIWCGLEYVRGVFLSGFAWNFLGVSQVNNLPVIQIASVGGVYAVSALLILINGALTSIVERALHPFMMRWKRQTLPVIPFFKRLLRSAESFIPFACVLGCVAWGFVRTAHWTSTCYTHPAWRIALIQPNTPCVFLSDATTEEERVKTLYTQTELASAGNPDLTLWPETALDGYLPYSRSARDMARRGVTLARSPLLTGTMEAAHVPVSAQAPQGRAYYNAAWLFNAQGEPLGRKPYRKQHLVPFGEYIPLDKTIPFLQKLAPTGVSCTPGDGANIFTLTKTNKQTLAIGALICFEDTVPELSRNAVQSGAQMLALVTNDAWFNGSIEPVQHLHQAIFRAVENGVPLVRCANSGVSCVVEPTGKTTVLRARAALSDFHGFMVLPVAVPQKPLTAIYTQYGDTLLAIPGMFLAFACIVGRRQFRIPFTRK